MPVMANIAVKAADGTTSITYTAQQGSAGDKVPAFWRNDSFSTIAANRPTLQVTAKAAKANTQRIVEVLFQYPEEVTNSTNGVKTVRLRDVGSAVFTLCEDAASTTNAEAVAQYLNLMASDLMKQILLSGRAPV